VIVQSVLRLIVLFRKSSGLCKWILFDDCHLTVQHKMKQEMPTGEKLIIKFLTGQLNGAEKEQFMAWLEADEGNRKLFSEYQAIWNIEKVRRELTDAAVKEDWQRLRRKMEALNKPVIKMRVKKNGYGRRWLQAAAVFVAGFAFSWYLFNGRIVVNKGATVYNEITTPLGSRSTIKLPDGSKIILNAGSKLRYPLAFDKKKREVYLEGEAFFDVAKDKKHEFLVNTPYITIKVYGTQFDVKAYATDKTVETTLVRGKISVIPKLQADKTRKKEIVLKPNQRLVLYKKGNRDKDVSVIAGKRMSEEKRGNTEPPKLIISKKVDPDYYTSWKDGRLIIRSERLDQLAVKLERRYDVRIHFSNDEVKKYRFTGIIENETVEQVFDAIKTASKIHYKIEERDIWID
jgi:ferric-dicitrate binding protein FerR (iron transport regulator)